MNSKIAYAAAVLLALTLSAQAQHFRPSLRRSPGERLHHAHLHHTRIVISPLWHSPARTWAWCQPRPFVHPSRHSTYLIIRNTRQYDSYTTSRAANGLFWGGVLGAIIGNNSGHRSHHLWNGAAIGAGLGYLFGSLSDRYEQNLSQTPSVPYRLSREDPRLQAAEAPPPNTQAIKSYYSTKPSRMQGANTLFGR